MGTFWQDIRYGLRMLAKRPGITLIAVLTLALGVGANTAIFSVVDAVLLRPLPYKQPDRLVFLTEESQQVPGMSISMADFNDWRATNTVFESMAPYSPNSAILTGNGETESLQVRQITAGLFPTLGVQPILGRALTPDDDKVGAAPVVLLGDGFWARKFASDPSVIGKQITLDGVSYTVIGVLPSSKFHGSWPRYSVFTSLWRQEDTLGGEANRSSHPGIYALARMKPGVILQQASTEMSGIAARLQKQYPKSNTGIGVSVDSVLNAYVGDIRPALLVLMAAVGFVLLIACANIANLSLARTTERNRELAIRTALGAGRFRLMRQLMTESMLLALIGGTLGLLVAYGVTNAVAKVSTSSVPRVDTVSIDGSVLLFTLGISLLTGLFFGLIPAWHASRTDVGETMKEGGRGGTAGAAKKHVRSALVVAEVSISLVLLVGAGLMIKSFYRVLQADPGFHSAGVLTGQFTLPNAQYKDAATRRQFVNQLATKLESIPGVDAAGVKLPLLGGFQTGFMIEGKPKPDPGKGPSTDISRVTSGALQAMGVPLLQGRYFTAADNETSESVCIIDTTMAQTQWPGENPIGKHVSVSGRNSDPNDPDWMKVVGVVAHTKNYGVDQPSRVETYRPFAQSPSSGGNVVLRSAGNPSGMAGPARDVILSIDANVPLSQVRELSDIVDENVAPRRLSVLLLSAFAALALVLSTVGIYGVMSYMVTQRSQEIGVRIALGAQRSDVMRLVLQNGMALLLLGLGIGLAGALALSRFLQSLLFQVKSTDIMTFASVPFLLAAVAFLACYLPARRATLVDPVVALRND
jgi:putative ABC transport system permease protein